MKMQLLLSFATAFGASLCCITPLMAMVAGTGSVASAVSWSEPLRPYLAASTFLLLGFAWVRSLKTKKEQDACGCEKKKSFVQSRGFLTTITIASLLLVAFPSYSHYLLQSTREPLNQQQNKTRHIELVVAGMTCTSCEVHIESSLKKLPGVFRVKASYKKGAVMVDYDDAKLNKEKIITTIDNIGYTVERDTSSALLQGKEHCTASSCMLPTGDLPRTINKDLIVIRGVGQIQNEFNRQAGKTRFIAVLSSTCKWCLRGADAVKKAVVSQMKEKNLAVIIVWTDMLQSDGENTAYRAASLFKNTGAIQFFDDRNAFGDLAAKAINPAGEQAWDVYMFFGQDAQWTRSLPRPFDYAHQLGPDTEWADQTKYFCGDRLTARLNEITKSL